MKDEISLKKKDKKWAGSDIIAIIPVLSRLRLEDSEFEARKESTVRQWKKGRQGERWDGGREGKEGREREAGRQAEGEEQEGLGYTVQR